MNDKLNSQYMLLASDRSSYLERGRQYSKMSLPYVLTDEGKQSGATNMHGWQGIGAEAVNHLSNKVVEALMPVAESFFTLDVDPDTDMELQEAGFDKTKLAMYFNKITDNAMRHMLKLQIRVKLIELERHLIISGNGALVISDEGAKVLGLDRFVCKRDSWGKILIAITEECITYEELTTNVKALIDIERKDKPTETNGLLKMYTGYHRQGDEYIITQTVNGHPTMEPNTVPAKLLPIIIPRWNSTSGEDYGRGLMEDHAGDFHVIEFLSEARARGAATMMDVKYLVRPGSLTDVATMNKAKTGDFIQGVEDDIVAFQLDKFADGDLIQNVMQEYTDRIGRAFMVLSASVRDSERTTKFEIQKLANELDLKLGGVYSAQTAELQTPLANQLLDMVSSDLLDELDIDLEPLVVTGIEALGRAQELEKLITYSEMMMLPQNWPEALQEKTDWDLYSEVIASNLSLDVGWLIQETEEDKADANEEEIQNQAGGKFADAMASSAGNELGKQMTEA